MFRIFSLIIWISGRRRKRLSGDDDKGDEFHLKALVSWVTFNTSQVETWISKIALWNLTFDGSFEAKRNFISFIIHKAALFSCVNFFFFRFVDHKKKVLNKKQFWFFVFTSNGLLAVPTTVCALYVSLTQIHFNRIKINFTFFFHRCQAARKRKSDMCGISES